MDTLPCCDKSFMIREPKPKPQKVAYRTIVFFWMTGVWFSSHINLVSAWESPTGFWSRIPTRKSPYAPRSLQRQQQQLNWNTRILSKIEDDIDSETDSRILSSKLNFLVGVLVQPIVGISLVSVVTTGGGLPAGPFGLIGAVEGLSYVIVVALALQSLVIPTNDRSIPQQLSLISLGLALVVLIQLIASQGCIPNAKPILDYSAYVRVCDPVQTPGFFGGGEM